MYFYWVDTSCDIIPELTCVINPHAPVIVYGADCGSGLVLLKTHSN